MGGWGWESKNLFGIALFGAVDAALNKGTGTIILYQYRPPLAGLLMIRQHFLKKI